MQTTIKHFILILILIITSSSIQAQNEYAISNKIEGKWIVYQSDIKGHIGTLVIEDNTYSFYPKPGVVISSYMKRRFSFIEQHRGTFKMESYRVKITDQIDDLEDHDIIGKSRFNNQTELFFIRYDREKHQLYFHATISELQVYSIIKKL